MTVTDASRWVERTPGPRIENVRDPLAVDFTILPVVPGGGDRQIRDRHEPLDGVAVRLRALDGDLPGLAGLVPAAGPHLAADVHEEIREPSIRQLRPQAIGGIAGHDRREVTSHLRPRLAHGQGLAD